MALALQPGITDVVANAANDWWVDSSDGLSQVENFALEPDNYERVLRLLVQLTGRNVDLVSPIADGAITAAEVPLLETHGVSRLRVHVALAAGIASQPLLAIRVHRAGVPTLEELCQKGMITASQASSLRRMIAERQNFVVVGATGAGKTTLLRALLAEETGLRTVVVEDTAELLPLPTVVHAVGLQARSANSDGAGFIGIDRLLRESLRMRPDRIVVGEVRGPEALVLLQAMNTGHSGSAATLHANEGESVLSRLRAMIPSASISDASLRFLAASAIGRIVLVERRPQGRRVTQIEDFAC